LRACQANAGEKSSRPNEVADGTLFLEAVLFDHDYWNETDIMTDFNEAEIMFDGKCLEPAAAGCRE